MRPSTSPSPGGRRLSSCQPQRHLHAPGRDPRLADPRPAKPEFRQRPVVAAISADHPLRVAAQITPAIERRTELEFTAMPARASLGLRRKKPFRRVEAEMQVVENALGLVVKL